MTATRASRAPIARAITDRLDSAAARSPGGPAVESASATYSRAALMSTADRLATALVARGVGPEVVVAAGLPSSAELVIAMVAVWKAGGAYLPVDPALPAERISYMLADAGCRLCITSAGLAGRLLGVETIDVEAPRAELSAAPPATRSDGLAYVIYTSGSTGRPKGVMVEHRSLANFVDVAARLGAPVAGRRVALVTSVSFDMSFKAISLMAEGATVCLPSEDVTRDPDALVAYLAGQRIDVLPCTPTIARLLVDAGLLDRVGTPERPLQLWLGGEPISERLWVQLRGTASVRALNMYGPTECTIDAAVCWLADAERPSIGRPIEGIEIRLVGPDGQPGDDQAEGEIIIAGVGVARGYLNQPGLTAERFVADAEGRRWYRTGDLARWSAQRRLEFVGRIDDQVKIRGYRIELGEIEQALANLAGQRAAAVVRASGSDEEAWLHAFLVGQPAEAADLRDRLAARLPEYMIPARFSWVGHLPLTRHGKVDRAALLAAAREQAAAPGAPERGGLDATPMQAKIAVVWREILGRGPDSLDEHFFASGGHSLLAIRLVARLRKTLGVALPVRLIFEHPTLRELTHAISEQPNGERQAAPPGRAATDFLWTPSPRPAESAVPMLCFAHAGGDVAVFGPLGCAASAAIEVRVPRLPGRGVLAREATPDTFNDLLEWLTERLRPVVSGPYALFGQSFGGMIAYELARRLAPAQPPLFLAVAGVAPPHLQPRVQPLDRNELLAELRSDGRIGPEVVNEPEVTRRALDAIEKDRQLMATYRYPGPFLLPCPVHAFVGRGDRTTNAEEMAQWVRHTSGPMSLTELDAGHLLVPDQSAAIAAELGNPG